MDREQIKKILEEAALEEAAENQLIWLYRTLLDLGVENCLEGNQQDVFRKGMDTLYEESKIHKELINNLIKKYS